MPLAEIFLAVPALLQLVGMMQPSSSMTAPAHHNVVNVGGPTVNVGSMTSPHDERILATSPGAATYASAAPGHGYVRPHLRGKRSLLIRPWLIRPLIRIGERRKLELQRQAEAKRLEEG